MSKLLIFQHVAYEILGTLHPLIKKSGFRIKYVNFERFPDAQPSIKDYKGLIVLGGPMSVTQTRLYPHLKTEMKVMEEAMKKGVPVFGICLGAQLLAHVLGSRVSRHPTREVGWYDIQTSPEGKKDPLLKHFRSSEKIFEWHEDAFTLPRGAVHLAESSTCKNQAFRYGEKTYGFQFHMEVDEPMVERWLNTAKLKKEWKILSGERETTGLCLKTQEHMPPLKELSQKTFHELIKLFGPKEKSAISVPSH